MLLESLRNRLVINFLAKVPVHIQTRHNVQSVSLPTYLKYENTLEKRINQHSSRLFFSSLFLLNSIDEIGWKEFADNWNKFRANEISAEEFAQKQYSPEVEIYINTGRCDVDGKFFGLKQARILSQKLKENLNGIFHPIGFRRCSDQETCDYRNTFETVRGVRVVVKVGLSETDLKVALITVTLEGADTMGTKFIEFHKGLIDAQTFVNTFFSEDVVLNAEDKNGIVRILNFEAIPAQLDNIRDPNYRTLDVTSRRQCFDRSGDCDFELTYELAQDTIIFWGSLNPAQNKIKRGTIRRMKSLYQ